MRVAVTVCELLTLSGLAWADCHKPGQMPAKSESCGAPAATVRHSGGAGAGAQMHCGPKVERHAADARTPTVAPAAEHHQHAWRALEHARHSFTDAIASVHREMPGARVIEARLDWCGDVPVYEIDAYVGGAVLKEVTIDARTGEVRDRDTERMHCRETAECTPERMACAAPPLDVHRAKELAGRQFDGFRIVATELRWEQQRPVYAVRLVSETHWAQVTLDARSGDVLQTQRNCKTYVANSCPALQPVDRTNTS